MVCGPLAAAAGLDDRAVAPLLLVSYALVLDQWIVLACKLYGIDGFTDEWQSTEALLNLNPIGAGKLLRNQ